MDCRWNNPPASSQISLCWVGQITGILLRAQRCFRDIMHVMAGCLAMLHDCYALLFIVGFFICRYMSVHRVRSPPPNWARWRNAALLLPAASMIRPRISSPARPFSFLPRLFNIVAYLPCVVCLSDKGILQFLFESLLNPVWFWTERCKSAAPDLVWQAAVLISCRLFIAYEGYKSEAAR